MSRSISYKGLRIIPACAGKSNGNANYNNASKDHPRMRGEKISQMFTKLSTSGSSPHARGKGCGIKRESHGIRIIPACAGKRVFSLFCILNIEDYGRMRGEKGLFSILYPNYLG